MQALLRLLGVLLAALVLPPAAVALGGGADLDLGGGLRVAWYDAAGPALALAAALLAVGLAPRGAVARSLLALGLLNVGVVAWVVWVGAIESEMLSVSRTERPGLVALVLVALACGIGLLRRRSAPALRPVAAAVAAGAILFFGVDRQDLRLLAQEIPEREAVPEGAHPDVVLILADTLRATEVDRLYSHQREAFDHIRAGRDTVLVSRTASGKTLSFLLPILDAYAEAESPFSVLLLYPTKALSRDQEGTLAKLLEAAGAPVRLGTLDGDTPREERTRIRSRADFAITNPDMLHAGVLPNHGRGWRSFLARLRYVVVDEVHTYRGAFGSHVANVFRRLRRVCRMHGSDPTFVCSSATIGNPGEHVEALFRTFVKRAVMRADRRLRETQDLDRALEPVAQDLANELDESEERRNLLDRVRQLFSPKDWEALDLIRRDVPQRQVAKLQGRSYQYLRLQISRRRNAVRRSMSAG